MIEILAIFIVIVPLGVAISRQLYHYLLQSSRCEQQDGTGTTCISLSVVVTAPRHHPREKWSLMDHRPLIRWWAVGDKRWPSLTQLAPWLGAILPGLRGTT
jgi:hypothetical protein